MLCTSDRRRLTMNATDQIFQRVRAKAHHEAGIDSEGVRLQAEAAWSVQPALRAEFLNDKAAYVAFCVAEAQGRFRVLGGTVVHAAGGQRGTV